LGRRFLLDSLEPRCLLATGLPGINAVTFDTSTTPPQVEITFDQNIVSQIDDMLTPFTGSSGEENFSVLLNILDSGSAFEIDQVAPDGTVLNQVVGPDNPAAVETVSDVISAGVQAVQVAIPIPGAALQPGNYQVCVDGLTNFATFFDLVEPGTAWDSVAYSSQPLVIGQFAISVQGASFQNNSFAPLTPSSQVTTVTGSLNPDDPAKAVDFYPFTLGPTPGHLWEVGLAIDTQSIGSPLQADLALFNAKTDKVVAYAVSGTGLPGDPGDPYLFAGVQPGSYYVAVSGAGNLPYGLTGYDPVKGTPGLLGLNQPGGPFPFELSIVAVPHQSTTTVTSSSANYLDPLSSSPTSLTLDFSAPIDLRNLFVVDQAEGSLELVDASNNIWPITPASYDVGQHQLTMAVDEPLPAGTYRLISPASDALLDLAGVPVVARGEPAGVLATFSVAALRGHQHATDLGVLWPNQIGIAPASIGDTFTGSLVLQPGQAITYRFVAIVPGLYKIQTVVNSGSISVQQIGPSGTSTLDNGSGQHVNNYIMKLASGIYQIAFADVGAQPAQFQWRMKIASVDWEKVIANGVGQSGALALSLLTTSAVDPTATSTAVAGFQGVPLAVQFASLTSGPSGPIPSNLLVTMNTSLMGQPDSTAVAIAAVGPGVEGASVALADGVRGLLPSIRYVSTDQADSGGDIDAPRQPADAPGAVAPGAVGPQAANRIDREAISILADQRALVQGEWLVRVAGMIRDWFGPITTDAHASPPEFDPAGSVTTLRAALGPDQKATETSRGRGVLETTARADIQFPAGFLVLAVAAHRLHDPVRRWWRRRPTPSGKGHRAFGPPYPPPHAPSAFARATTRAHK
jgi:hypothetical protein